MPIRTILLMMFCAGTASAQQCTTGVILQRSYWSAGGAPFYNQVAVYVGDIESQGKDSWKAFDVYLLIGNGRRPFPTANGSLSPSSFNKFVSSRPHMQGLTLKPL